jgi:uncharacterized protein (DUF2147 family)
MGHEQMNRSASIICMIAGLSWLASAMATGPSAAGRWQIINDQGGKPTGVMKIYEHNGEYCGMLEEVYDNPGKLCVKCAGDKKDRPVQGLTIMEGLRRNGEHYTGGRILDPSTGHVWRCKLRLSPDGDTLVIRGYLGVSLLGRNQTWHRLP